jgi:hypothetical protein
LDAPGARGRVGSSSNGFVGKYRLCGKLSLIMNVKEWVKGGVSGDLLLCGIVAKAVALPLYCNLNTLEQASLESRHYRDLLP